MSTSAIYRSATGYEWLMRALYGRHYRARLELVAERVPQGVTVVELCCGPGTLYLRHLRGKVGGYIGLDVNAGFVERLRAAGVDARAEDLSRPEVALPQADVLVIQASLYHFLPHAGDLVDRMLAAARQRVIVAEPVRNLSSSQNPVLALLGQRSTDPGAGGHEQRFTDETLLALMRRYGGRVQESVLIPGGRERIYVLRAGA